MMNSDNPTRCETQGEVSGDVEDSKRRDCRTEALVEVSLLSRRDFALRDRMLYCRAWQSGECRR